MGLGDVAFGPLTLEIAGQAQPSVPAHPRGKVNVRARIGWRGGDDASLLVPVPNRGRRVPHPLGLGAVEPLHQLVVACPQRLCLPLLGCLRIEQLPLYCPERGRVVGRWGFVGRDRRTRPTCRKPVALRDRVERGEVMCCGSRLRAGCGGRTQGRRSPPSTGPSYSSRGAGSRSPEPACDLGHGQLRIRDRLGRRELERRGVDLAFASHRCVSSASGITPLSGCPRFVECFMRTRPSDRGRESREPVGPSRCGDAA